MWQRFGSSGSDDDPHQGDLLRERRQQEAHPKTSSQPSPSVSLSPNHDDDDDEMKPPFREQMSNSLGSYVTIEAAVTALPQLQSLQGTVLTSDQEISYYCDRLRHTSPSSWDRNLRMRVRLPTPIWLLLVVVPLIAPSSCQALYSHAWTTSPPVSSPSLGSSISSPTCSPFMRPLVGNSSPPSSTSRSSPRGMISKQQLGSFEVLETGAQPRSKRKVALLDYTSDPSTLIDFGTAWDWQKHLLDRHVDRLVASTTMPSPPSEDGGFLPHAVLGDDSDGRSVPSSFVAGHDTVIMLQHNPVYTLGTGSDERFVLSAPADIPVIRMDRGGEVTYHGPGQLTVYPILDLRGYNQDIHWYMRALEEAIIVALSKCPGLIGRGPRPAERQHDVTGVWMDDHKVAAVGIKCRKWITNHGLAVNVEESSLANFGGIIPCGLDGRKVGCINQFATGEPLTVPEFATIMKEALEEVFQIQLVKQDLLL